jgi:hypothetical protein
MLAVAVAANFVVDTVICVVVGVVPPPPPPLLPPPQPRVKLNTHISPIPSAARYRFRPGKNSRKMAARPVPALSVHNPVRTLAARGSVAARNSCVSGIFIAVVVVDGAATFTVSDPVPFPPPLVTGMLSAPQVTPGTVVPQLITTPVLVNPPLGVNVIVDVPLPPAITLTLDPARLYEPPEVPWVTVIGTAALIAEAV